MKTRDTFIFYRSFFESINNLDIENQGKIYHAISDYSLNRNEPNFTGICLSIWLLIKPQLDANIKRFENGNKSKKSKQQAKAKQTISKVEANNNKNKNKNNNKNENKNINIIPAFSEFLDYAKTIKPNVSPPALKMKYDSWVVNGWKDGNDKKITNWKSKIINTLPYIAEQAFVSSNPTAGAI